MCIQTNTSAASVDMVRKLLIIRIAENRCTVIINLAYELMLEFGTHAASARYIFYLLLITFTQVFFEFKP